MTTNHLEKLDEALIRPGRVDMKIEFPLCSKSMLTQIFCNIYSTLEGDAPSPKEKVKVEIRSPKKMSLGLLHRSAIKTADELLDDEDNHSERLREAEEERKAESIRIQKLGLEFAQLIPGDALSPAKTQGFLLKHKREPETAIERAEEWAKEIIAAKEKEKEKTKVEQKAAEENAKERSQNDKEDWTDMSAIDIAL